MELEQWVWDGMKRLPEYWYKKTLDFHRFPDNLKYDLPEVLKDIDLESLLELSMLDQMFFLLRNKEQEGGEIGEVNRMVRDSLWNITLGISYKYDLDEESQELFRNYVLLKGATKFNDYLYHNIKDKRPKEERATELDKIHTFFLIGMEDRLVDNFFNKYNPSCSLSLITNFDKIVVGEDMNTPFENIYFPSVEVAAKCCDEIMEILKHAEFIPNK